MKISREIYLDLEKKEIDRNKVSGSLDKISYMVSSNNKVICHEEDYGFSATVMPGCCGIMTVFDLYIVTPEPKASECILDMAYSSGYTKVLATVVKDTKEHVYFLKNDWKEVDSFVNKRSQNNVIVISKDV